ncbi:substrate-binding periplasmic protein [Falsiroseomonas sp. E2-1-a20]|uniref:substrate-binding periplasmic protein n=1 Tax=Falsiroseomonas sp. E2-1-a20 TaxID=3239300 RepID=UPI003F33AA3C
MTVVYGAFPPFTITDPARPGIVNEVAGEVLRMVGRVPNFVPLEWAEAQARGRTDANTLLTPPGRTPAREPHYTWIVKVMDFESAIGSLGGTGPLDLEGARRLSRMGIISQSFHEAFLRAQGFTNLVPVSLANAMDALVSGEIEALYTQTLELRWHARARGRSADLKVGPRLQNVESFIVTSRAATGVPVAEMRDAFAALESEGAVDRIVRSYLG